MHYPLLHPTTSFDAIILAGGNYPSHALPRAILAGACHIVCCDSAFDLLEPSLIDRVDAIVGDGDSLPEAAKQQYKSLLYIESEQDDNDLTKATRYCRMKGYHRLAFLGTTGKREDHALGNISLLTEYAKDPDLQPVFITDYGIFVACTGDATFESFARQQVSIFNFGCTLLTSEGLRWNAYAFQNWWQGTLNEAMGSSFTIHADRQYLVYRTYEAK
ncbi:MAG: thiamine diphosphokinase [Prevotella sp.]